MNKYIYEIELDLYRINSETIQKIVKRIREEVFRKCENDFRLESIAYGSQCMLFFYGNESKRTGILDVTAGIYEEYDSYRYVPEDVMGSKFYYLNNDNVYAYKFTALLLKLCNGENFEEREKCVYALNAILRKEVFGIDLCPFYQKVLMKDMNLIGCIEYIDNQERDKNYSFLSNDLYSYVVLKESIDNYFCDKLSCTCDDPVRVNDEESEEYYGITKKIVKEGGRIQFGEYGNVAIEMAKYNHIYQITFKVFISEISENTYNYHINRMEREAEGALLYGGVEVDIDYGEAERKGRQTVDNWVSRVMCVAETMNAVVCRVGDRIVWSEAFYCEKPTIEKLLNRIKQVYDRVDALIVFGENAYHCNSDEYYEYEDILKCMKGDILPDII